MACHGFHDVVKTLPPAQGAMRQNVGIIGPVHFHLLNHIEQDALLSNAQSPKGYARWDVNNTYTQVVGIYLSPLDPTVTTGQTNLGALWAETSYGYNFQVFGNGRVAGSPDVVLGNPNTTNIAFWFGRTRLTAIQDGTTNTIMFAEKLAQCGCRKVDFVLIHACANDVIEFRRVETFEADLRAAMVRLLRERQ